MDDTLLARGPSSGTNAWNIMIRELLGIITGAGIRWDADATDQLAAAVHGLCYENEPLYYENEVIVSWL